MRNSDSAGSARQKLTDEWLAKAYFYAMGFILGVAVGAFLYDRLQPIVIPIVKDKADEGRSERNFTPYPRNVPTDASD